MSETNYNFDPKAKKEPKHRIRRAGKAIGRKAVGMAKAGGNWLAHTKSGHYTSAAIGAVAIFSGAEVFYVGQNWDTKIGAYSDQQTQTYQKGHDGKAKFRCLNADVRFPKGTPIYEHAPFNLAKRGLFSQIGIGIDSHSNVNRTVPAGKVVFAHNPLRFINGDGQTIIGFREYPTSKISPAVTQVNANLNARFDNNPALFNDSIHYINYTEAYTKSNGQYNLVVAPPATATKEDPSPPSSSCEMTGSWQFIPSSGDTGFTNGWGFEIGSGDANAMMYMVKDAASNRPRR